ncbi:MAG: DUF2945 domain-containing protein [Planctomycetaceae bacterium]|jgi:hypothetical protein
MSDSYDVGTKVKWKWGNGWGRGRVDERFSDKVTRTIACTEVTRTASDDKPAYLIEQDDGERVRKSHSEIQQDD